MISRRAALIGVVLLALIIYEITQLPPWFWPGHALGVCSGTKAQIIACKSYNLYSGEGSDVSEITLPVTLILAALAVHRFLHQHFECHEETCKKLGLHHFGHHRVCWEHHPVLGAHAHRKVPLHVIHGHHLHKPEEKQ